MASQTELAYETIRQRILDYTYAPSETIVESALAEELSVSRNTIKKAIMLLVNEKLVTVEDNKSAKVKSLTLSEVIELMEIRERLEGLIAYRVAQVIKSEELSILKNILLEMEGLSKEHKFIEYSAKNVCFHNMIYSICPNKEAVNLVQSLRVQLRRYNTKTILIAGRSESSYKEHSDILAAMEKHDPFESEKLMRLHVGNVSNILQANYSILL